MEHMPYRINFPFLRYVANEDYNYNAWPRVAMEWMDDFGGYFDDHEEEVLDEVLDEQLFEDDEGVDVSEPATSGKEMVDTTKVFLRQERFCVVTSAVKICAGREFLLCSKCFIIYTDCYDTEVPGHLHIMHHLTLNDPNGVLTIRRSCESCHKSLTVFSAQRVCLICNGV